MGFISILKHVLPLSPSKKKQFLELTEFFDKPELKTIKRELKQGTIHVAQTKLQTSEWLMDPIAYPQIHFIKKVGDIQLDLLNKHIYHRIMRRQVLSFGKSAEQKLPSAIGVNIEGMDSIKYALALQLVSKEHFHVLLLGDPGTGKTDLIRTASSLHPIHTFGLGSGTSSVGLTVSVKGKSVVPGLLPSANNGICAIDELNLVKKGDLGSLYNAMEKGFITYNKGDKSLTFDAKVRIAATANPKGDKFVGKSLNILKQQIPFDTALLTRFHITFFIRSPNIQKFNAITKKIISNQKTKLTEVDKEFLQEFTQYAETLEVDLPESLHKKIIDFAQSIKENEKKYLVEISPRIVHAIIRLAKANARLNLRRKVFEHDVEVAQNILKNALETVN